MWALLAAVLGFFVITLDAVVVNVALPAIGREVGGGIAALQWVVDGYTLAFAVLLLSAGWSSPWPAMLGGMYLLACYGKVWRGVFGC